MLPKTAATGEPQHLPGMRVKIRDAGWRIQRVVRSAGIQATGPEPCAPVAAALIGQASRSGRQTAAQER